MPGGPQRQFRFCINRTERGGAIVKGYVLWGILDVQYYAKWLEDALHETFLRGGGLTSLRRLPYEPRAAGRRHRQDAVKMLKLSFAAPLLLQIAAEAACPTLRVNEVIEQLTF